MWNLGVTFQGNVAILEGIVCILDKEIVERKIVIIFLPNVTLFPGLPIHRVPFRLKLEE